ncbi:MAG: serine/threonine-protein kinase [Lentisphaeria bacterium]|nr:serine/threonine-protein kinase [Lentisphaeria bacterium]
MSTPEQASIIPGTIVGGFRVEAFVGAGAMAVVYRATQINLDRPVALKILPGNFSRSRDYVDRFFNEARAAAAFSHPNIVRAYDADIDENNVCYFAMEFIEGETVLDRIEREGRLPLLDSLQIALGIAEALDYGWHEHRLTHGDIKPANLMINQRGETKLADFGLAKVAEIEDVEGSIMLTPLYASPEVIQGYQPKEDCRPDIYAFGATLYHMLSGEPPFPGDDSKEVMRLQVEQPLTPLRKRCPDIPQHVSDFVSFLLEKDPGQRAQSWAQVVEGLEMSLDLMNRKGALVTATATAAKAPAAAARKARTAKRAKRQLAHQTSRRKNGLSVGLVVLACLIALATIAGVVAMLAAVNRPAPPPADPPGPTVTPSTADTPRVPKSIPWKQVNKELSARSGHADRLAVLKRYLPAAERDSDKLELHRRIKREERKLAEEKEHRQTVKENPPAPKPPTETGDPAAPDTESGYSVNQALDDYTDIAFAVASHELSFSPPPDTVNALISAWRANYPDDAPPTGKVAFLATVMWPAHSRLRSHLIDNQDLFKDLKIPGREHRITALSGGGIDASIALAGGGQVKTRLDWAEISSPAVVKAFVKKLLAKQDITDDERRAALSCMAIEGAVSAVDTLSAKLPEAEHQSWVALTTDLAAAKAEKTALDTLVQAERAVEKKVYLTAHGFAKDVLASDTSVPLRYKDRLDTIMAAVLPHTPEHQLRNMADQAEAMVVTNPRKALALAVMSLGKYGRLNSPATTRFKQVADQAASQIATELAAGAGVQQFDSQFKPFTPATLTQRRFGESLGVMRLHSRLDTLPQAAAFHQKSLVNVAWLTSAYWEKAVTAFPLSPPGETSTLSDWQRYFLAYADALIIARDKPRRPLLEQRLAGLHAFTAGSVRSLTQAVLTLQYAFITETSDTAARLSWPEVDESMADIAVAHDYVLTLAALHLANHDSAAASQILQASLRSQQLAFSVPGEDLNPAFHEKIRVLRWLITRLSGIPPGSEGNPRNPPYEALNNSPSGRWMLYQLFIRNVLSEEERIDIADKMTRREYVCSMLDARRLFENLLLTTATYLKAGDSERALAAIDMVLGHDSPFLVEYYPRVLALKAGVLMAGKQLTAARETLLMIQLCSAASTAEHQWAAYFSTAASSRVSGGAGTSAASLTDYWSAWLNYGYWQGAGNAKLAAQESAALRTMSANGVKQALAQCLPDDTSSPNKN